MPLFTLKVDPVTELRPFALHSHIVDRCVHLCKKLAPTPCTSDLEPHNFNKARKKSCTWVMYPFHYLINFRFKNENSGAVKKAGKFGQTWLTRQIRARVINSEPRSLNENSLVAWIFPEACQSQFSMPFPTVAAQDLLCFIKHFKLPCFHEDVTLRVARSILQQTCNRIKIIGLRNRTLLWRANHHLYLERGRCCPGWLIQKASPSRKCLIWSNSVQNGWGQIAKMT